MKQPPASLQSLRIIWYCQTKLRASRQLRSWIHPLWNYVTSIHRKGFFYSYSIYLRYVKYIYDNRWNKIFSKFFTAYHCFWYIWCKGMYFVFWSQRHISINLESDKYSDVHHPFFYNSYLFLKKIMFIHFFPYLSKPINQPISEIFFFLFFTSSDSLTADYTSSDWLILPYLKITCGPIQENCFCLIRTNDF